MGGRRQLWLVVLATLSSTLAGAQLPMAVPQGVSLQLSNGQFRLHAEYADLLTRGSHSLEYHIVGSAPLGDTAALAANSDSSFSGGGYRLHADVGWMVGSRGTDNGGEVRNFSMLGVATDAAANDEYRHFFSVRLRGGADYDRHDVVSKESPDWTTQSPTAIADYRLQLHGVLVGRFELPRFMMAVTGFGGVSWSHEFEVASEEVCAPVTPGSETTSCRTLPTTDELPDGAKLVAEAGGSLTLLFYGPAAVDEAVRVNPGIDVGFKMTFDDPAHSRGRIERNTTLLNVGVFITPNFGLTGTAVRFRSGIWLDIPLDGFDDEAPSFTVLLGATY